MLQMCSKALVKAGKLRSLLKPVSVTVVRNQTRESPLPKMPIPPLKQSCELYLSVLETFLEPEEMKHTKHLVDELIKPGGVGERLQRGLEKRARNTENCLADDYLKYEYFLKRRPLVVFLNVGILCPREDVRDKQGQLRSAAELAVGLLDVKTMIDNGTLPVDYMRGKPQCMKQYKQVFSSCRIPGPKMDSVVVFSRSLNPPKHITVAHNGQFFALDVYNSDGTVMTVDQFYVQLEKICSSSMEANVEPVGILTSQHRDTWSKLHNSLMQDETNRESLSAIESSIFTLCLDGAMPPEPDEMMSCRSGLLQMLHGGGSQWYSGNRWFDKGLQVIVGEDGTRGFHCGHTIADGSVYISVSDHALTKIKNGRPLVMKAPSEPLAMPRKLHFNIPPEIKQAIKEAKQQLDTLTQKMDLTVSVFDHFGKNAIKAHNMSPDAFVQIAIQLAYYRVYNKCCSALEPISLRSFRMGRVAMMNSNTSASLAFVKAFDDPKKQDIEKIALLEEALKEHKRRIDMVLSGVAAGEHLTGLKSQASMENIPLPDVFTDSCFTRAYEFNDLSTSQSTSRTGCLSCVCLEQLGTYDVSYGIMDEHIDCRVSSLEASDNSKDKNPARLSQALEDALLDMMSLLKERRRSKV